MREWKKVWYGCGARQGAWGTVQALLVARQQQAVIEDAEEQRWKRATAREMNATARGEGDAEMYG
jgi:hypothetical protein